ncbi:probable 28S ribosomal protein S23, mitochondrial [Pollicipes pollicipes]|uniref:probable 28S ribosomal protein S23, mitochondrial n=1 Tax=Pollicipes pollicipes TaxID=41117 RepID=UPI0018852FFD|nr:probable 28S ribosomal protein S23, mitochondrial [Pollicipes pollicipes]
MAQTRLEKIGTIFTRVSGLIRSGSMHRDDRPLWYDVYEAFPPRLEPRFDRPVKAVPVRPIFYQEDAVRARFQREFGSPGVLRLRGSPDGQPASVCDEFVERCDALRRAAPASSEDELFEAAADALRAEGVKLGRSAGGESQAPPPPAAPALRVADLFEEQRPSGS